MSRPNPSGFSRKARKKVSSPQTTEIPVTDASPVQKHSSFFSANKWRIIGGVGLMLIGIAMGTSVSDSPTDSADYKQLAASYTEAQSSLTTAKNTIVDLNKDIQKKESTIKELQSSKKTLEAERNKWTDQGAAVKEKETKIAELDGKIATLTSERDTCQANLTNASTASGSSTTTTSEDSNESYSSTPQGFVAPAPEPAQNVYYKNCTEARAAGVTPIYAGEPGYSGKLDRDGDGVACE